MTTHRCPVCAYQMPEPPEEGNICSCCGTEFGYDDDLGVTYRQLRELWISRGMPWFSPAARPPMIWNPVRQLVEAEYDFEMPDSAITVTTDHIPGYWFELENIA